MVTNNIKRIISALFLVLVFSSVVKAATHEPLSMDEGFKFSAKVRDSQTVLAEWQMAPGYFLYSKKLRFSTATTGAKLGNPILPNATIKNEPGFGNLEIYSDKVSVPIPVVTSPNDQKIELSVTYQGCSEEGFCYPPTTKTVSLDLKNINVTANENRELLGLTPDTSHATAPQHTSSEQDTVAQVLSGGHFITIILSFLGFGLLLAFTPCVLPMVPILSGIIVGHKKQLTTKRAFTLSLIYVLSMALTYAIAGILVGYAGGSIQATFQKPWVLITFSAFFVLLALSFFGLYELQLPSRFQNSLNDLSNKQKSGSYLGVAVMGCIATLIVSPCVTPALVGALAYIGQTGNAVLGGTALFALGFGMGLPLLIIGTLGGKFLPKAGKWMESIKTVFGVLLLAMAIWIIDRIIPGPLELLLWGTLLIISAVFMGIFSKKDLSNWSRLNHGLSIVFFVYGVLLTIGAAMGNHNPLLPLYVTHYPSFGEPVEMAFHAVDDKQQLTQALGKARSENKLVLLDFYAKWCTSCKIMEHRTFNHPEVIKALNNFVALKADVTNNDQTAKSLEQQYKVVAPPTFLFFDHNGKELTQFRIVGEMGPEKFLEHLKTVQEWVSK